MEGCLSHFLTFLIKTMSSSRWWESFLLTVKVRSADKECNDLTRTKAGSYVLIYCIICYLSSKYSSKSILNIACLNVSRCKHLNYIYFSHYNGHVTYIRKLYLALYSLLLIPAYKVGKSTATRVKQAHISCHQQHT